jgi:hypothetical protein
MGSMSSGLADSPNRQQRQVVETDSALFEAA